MSSICINASSVLKTMLVCSLADFITHFEVGAHAVLICALANKIDLMCRI